MASGVTGGYNTEKAFQAIKEFVVDLHTAFNEGVNVATPLMLFWRLVTTTNVSATASEKTKDAVGSLILEFANFLSKYELSITQSRYNDIPKGARISFKGSPKIYIDIQQFIHQSDDDTRLVIRQHLLTISTIINPDEQKIKDLEQALTNNLALAVPDDGSPEAAFVNMIAKDAKSALSDVDSDNPTGAMMGIINSGVVTKMISGLQDGVGSGEMDIQKLFQQMQKAVTTFMPSGKSE